MSAVVEAIQCTHMPPNEPAQPTPSVPPVLAVPPVPEIDDVTKSAEVLLWGKYKWLFLLSLVGGIALAILSGIAIYGTYSSAGNTSGNEIILPFLFLLIPLGVWQYIKAKVQHQFMQQMATDLGYTYSAAALFSSVSGVSFSEGHSQKLVDVISGTYRDCPVRIFTYYYTVGSGKNSHTYIETIFELTYITPLPHVLLGTSEHLFAGDVERVSLEGDFNNYFKLYIAKGHQVEAREIFQPDVMQDFITSFQKLGFEIYGNKVYVIRNGILSKKADFLSMQNLIDSLIDKLLPGLHAVASS